MSNVIPGTEAFSEPLTIGNVPPYAWPGGYPIGYLTEDGAYLCAACVNDPTNPVHTESMDDNKDGWMVVGFQTLEGSPEDYDGSIYCAHCNEGMVTE